MSTPAWGVQTSAQSPAQDQPSSAQSPAPAPAQDASAQRIAELEAELARVKNDVVDTSVPAQGSSDPAPEDNRLFIVDHNGDRVLFEDYVKTDEYLGK